LGQPLRRTEAAECAAQTRTVSSRTNHHFYVNSTLYDLANGDSSGDFSIAVNAGDAIKFAAFTADNCCGAANTVISNFDAPTSVPEPGSVLLMGAGIAGLLARRRFNKRSAES
jgi:hypothetical protein